MPLLSFASAEIRHMRMKVSCEADANRSSLFAAKLIHGYYLNIYKVIQIKKKIVKGTN